MIKKRQTSRDTANAIGHEPSAEGNIEDGPVGDVLDENTTFDVIVSPTGYVMELSDTVDSMDGATTEVIDIVSEADGTNIELIIH